MAYATTQELAQFMNIGGALPNKDLEGEDRPSEEVGTGDNSKTKFFLDHAYVINSSESLRFAATEDVAGTALVLTTDYTIDDDLGKITLTTAGRTAVGTNNIYADYSFTTVGLTDTQLSDALTRAEKEVDNQTNNHFADGTAATPDWNQFLNQKQMGKGVTDNNYFTLQNYPLPDVSTTLDGAVTAEDATITVVSTNGFPSSGSFLIGSDKILYTGKDTTNFTGCTSVEAHDDGSTVKPYVVEISTTNPGGSITWQVLTEDTEFDLDRKTARVHLYENRSITESTIAPNLTMPPRLVANRFRASFISGNSTIPVDITKATLMLAAKDLMSTVVRQAHTNGLNDFNPDLINIDEKEFDKIISHYRNEQYARV